MSGVFSRSSSLTGKSDAGDRPALLILSANPHLKKVNAFRRGRELLPQLTGIDLATSSTAIDGDGKQQFSLNIR